MADPKLMLEPRLRTRAPGVHESSGATALPDDLLREQCARLSLLYAVGAGIWTIAFVMDRWLLPQGRRELPVQLIEAAGIAASLLLVAYARFSP